jgi:hypothetical protein
MADRRRPAHEVTVGGLFTEQDPVELRGLLDSGIELDGSVRRLAERVIGRDG